MPSPSPLRTDKYVICPFITFEGVRDLKHFLEYAQRGTRALIEAADAPGGFFDSPFEQAVSERLQSKGWTTHSQVGVSGFRIDLGIVNPDAPGKYLSAIECDGATYHRSTTARDRDFLREQVLRGLGWEVIRIWSTDWWIDSQSAIERVDNELRGMLEDFRVENKSEDDELTQAHVNKPHQQADESNAVSLEIIQKKLF